jgi:excisionase family DNA binding protein
MNEIKSGVETYMTIEEVAAYLKLANQTIRKYVLNKSIPYRKVQKSVRFRLSEIEVWINAGGGYCPDFPLVDREGDLFAETETGAADQSGESEEGGADGETGRTAKTGEVCCLCAVDSLGVCCANSSEEKV